MNYGTEAGIQKVLLHPPLADTQRMHNRQHNECRPSFQGRLVSKKETLIVTTTYEILWFLCVPLTSYPYNLTLSFLRDKYAQLLLPFPAAPCSLCKCLLNACTFMHHTYHLQVTQNQSTDALRNCQGLADFSKSPPMAFPIWFCRAVVEIILCHGSPTGLIYFGLKGGTCFMCLSSSHGGFYFYLPPPLLLKG